MAWASSHSYPAPVPLSIAGLAAAIRNSAIKAAYAGASLSADTLTIGFKANLDVSDVTVLDGLVAAHTGADPARPPKTVISRSEILSATGLPAVTILSAMPGTQYISQGYQMEASPSTLHITDIQIGKYLIGTDSIANFSGGKYICRTPASRGSAIHFAFVDRDGVLEVPGMPGVRLFDALGLKLSCIKGATGAWVVGEEIIGQTSGAETYVIRAGANGVEVEYFVHNPDGSNAAFLPGETVVGQTSGTTAVLDAVTPFVEGDVFEVQRPIRHEFLEGLQSELIDPDGARPIPRGLYARFYLNNSSTVDSLLVDTFINLNTEA